MRPSSRPVATKLGLLPVLGVVTGFLLVVPAISALIALLAALLLRLSPPESPLSALFNLAASAGYVLLFAGLFALPFAPIAWVLAWLFIRRGWHGWPQIITGVLGFGICAALLILTGLPAIEGYTPKLREIGVASTLGLALSLPYAILARIALKLFFPHIYQSSRPPMPD